MPAKSTNRATCQHRNVNLRGNDETGLASISCGDCGIAMSRRYIPTGVASGYVYYPICEYCGAEKKRGESCGCFDNGGQ